MKNRTGILLMLTVMISLLAYGCTASGSVGTNKQQDQKSSASKRQNISAGCISRDVCLCAMSTRSVYFINHVRACWKRARGLSHLAIRWISLSRRGISINVKPLTLHLITPGVAHLSSLCTIERCSFVSYLDSGRMSIGNIPTLFRRSGHLV